MTKEDYKRPTIVCVPLLLFVCFFANSLVNGRRLRALRQTTTEGITGGDSRDLEVSHEPDGEFKCAPWEVDMDPWWQAHPTWESYGDNLTHTCFRPIPDQQHADFLHHVYMTQYHMNTCADLRTRNIIGTGYAAAIGRLAMGFYAALRDGRPFANTRHWDGFRWLYVPKPPEEGSNEPAHWAACPEGDHTCYFLPISNCAPTPGTPEAKIRNKQGILDKRKAHDDEANKYAWLEGYMTRPNQVTRQHLAQLLDQEAPSLPSDQDCTWIHVRRGDAQTEWKHPRNFHAISEYLEKGNVTKGGTVLLLTDDETALEEAHLLHPEYNWVAWNRTRNRGVAKQNSHIPSNDKAKEILILIAEIKLAGQCSKAVHGTSNMVHMFENSMIRQHGGRENIQMIPVEKKGEKKVKASDFMKDLEAKLAEAKAAQAAKQQR